MDYAYDMRNKIANYIIKHYGFSVNLRGVIIKDLRNCSLTWMKLMLDTLEERQDYFRGILDRKESNFENDFAKWKYLFTTVNNTCHSIRNNED